MKRNIIVIMALLLTISLSGNVYLLSKYNNIKLERIALPECLKENIVKDHDWNSLMMLIEECGDDVAFPYALYLADVANDASACDYCYMLVKEFYNNLGVKMPQNSFNMVFPYLKRGAEANDPYALAHMKNLYKEGIYVPRDTALSNYYSKKAHEAWEKVQ